MIAPLREPFDRFLEAMGRARAGEPFEGARAALATVDAAGMPSVRYVLVKDCGESGFPFFTNYESPKAKDLDVTGRAALVWHWDSLGQQVRASGTVMRASAAESDAYFAVRPRGSQIGAWASRQSTAIDSRESLEATVADLEKKFGDGPVPRPPFWGGYVLTPQTMEFWSEGKYRLHDRWLFTREGEGWRVTRLSP
jgi:pyridoxamine 5'-phosphate oxidase